MLNKIKISISKYFYTIINSKLTTIILFVICCLLLVLNFIDLLNVNHFDSLFVQESTDNKVLSVYQYRIRLNRDFLPENIAYNSNNIVTSSPTPITSKLSQERMSSTSITPSLTPVVTSPTTIQDSVNKSDYSNQRNNNRSNNNTEEDKNLNIKLTSKSTAEGRDRDRELIFRFLLDTIEEYEFYHDKLPEIYIDKSGTLLSDDPSSVIYFYNGNENRTNAIAINLGNESYMFIRVESCTKVVFEDYLMPFEFNIENKKIILCMESGGTKIHTFD